MTDQQDSIPSLKRGRGNPRPARLNRVIPVRWEDTSPVFRAAKLRGIPVADAIRKATLRWAMRVLDEEARKPA